MITDPSRVPLSRRAWIGNSAGGALVSADGTIDWYSPDGVQSPPALWRLLDPNGGAVRVGPERSGSGAMRSLPPNQQRYLPGSNVVETILEGAGGRSLRVTDFVEWPGPGLDAPSRIVRVARALAGPLSVEVEVYPSGRLAGGPAGVTQDTADGMLFDGIAVRSGARLEPEPVDRSTPRWRAVRRLDEGESFVVTIETASPAEALTVDGAMKLLEGTLLSWRSWATPLVYDGPYRSQVERSFLAIRSLTVGGAPAGSATTSVPRRIGSERNFDSRWVRWQDVAGSALAYARAGLAEDSLAAEAWLRNTVAEAPVPFPMWLDLDGQPPPDLETLSLLGWKKSEPVVVGVPDGRIDLDCYGDVVAAIGASAAGPGRVEGDPGPLTGAWAQLSAAADWVADHWTDPDSGVWASDGPAAVLVSSRVQAAYALDRMARLAWRANPLDLAAVPWREQSREITSWLEREGRAPDGGLRRNGGEGGDEPDAALLRIAWRGPWPPLHPIVTRTVERVLERLTSSGLLFRYSERVDDGHAGPDNPDLLASLWAVRALASLERWDDAHQRMEAVTRLTGTTGLLSEAADPLSGELMGNLPSTAVHLAVVDAAFALARGPA